MIKNSPLLCKVFVSALQAFHTSVPDHPVLSKSSWRDHTLHLSFLLQSEVESVDMHLFPLAGRKET